MAMPWLWAQKAAKSWSDIHFQIQPDPWTQTQFLSISYYQMPRHIVQTSTVNFRVIISPDPNSWFHFNWTTRQHNSLATSSYMCKSWSLPCNHKIILNWLYVQVTFFCKSLVSTRWLDTFGRTQTPIQTLLHYLYSITLNNMNETRLCNLQYLTNHRLFFCILNFPFNFLCSHRSLLHQFWLTSCKLLLQQSDLCAENTAFLIPGH